MVRSGMVSKFDYGMLNRIRYGQFSPPTYNLANIPNDFPLMLSSGGKDYLSDTNDMKTLMNELKDHQKDRLVVQFTEKYAHVDFLMGENDNNMIFQHIIEFFKLH